MLFDLYLFADYSGAQKLRDQRKAIRLAEGARGRTVTLLTKRFTRNELADELVGRLKDATRAGVRVCFGQDHQYSIPWQLAKELSVERLPWRDALGALCSGSYGESAPALGHPVTFASALNEWLTNRGFRPFFYSATKGAEYNLPTTDPRSGDESTYRLTELCKSRSGTGSAKPLNRVGDRGYVGGQSLLGMVALARILHRCASEGVKVAAWPFDGLSIDDSAYSDSHVLIEPYPSAVRAGTVAQTDDEDALASTAHISDLDARGVLSEELDLSGLDAANARIAKFEGWIVSHQPNTRRIRKRQANKALHPAAATAIMSGRG